MQMTHQTPHVRLDPRAPGELDADLLIVPTFDRDTFADVPGLAQASGGEALASALGITMRHWKGEHEGDYWRAHCGAYLRFYANALADC